MITPLNKAYSAANKAAGATRKETETMKKEFETVLKVASSVDLDPDNRRAEYTAAIEEARANLKKALEDKESAVTGAAFDHACDAERRAQDKENFFSQKLNTLNHRPRMDRAEYDEHVKTVADAVESAAEDFRVVAVKAMADLSAARAAYWNVLEDADTVMIELDRAANVLQSEYFDKWKMRAVRYTPAGHGIDILTRGVPGSINEPDRVIMAAWSVAGRV